MFQIFKALLLVLSLTAINSYATVEPEAVFDPCTKIESKSMCTDAQACTWDETTQSCTSGFKIQHHPQHHHHHCYQLCHHSCEHDHHCTWDHYENVCYPR